VSVKDTYEYVLKALSDPSSLDRVVKSQALLKKMIKPRLLFYRGDTNIWFYIGTRYDHIIVPRTYCSCKEFLINVMSRKKKLVCKHLLIQELSEKTSNYRVVEISEPSLLYKIINEILDMNISPTLRKLLYVREERG